MFHKADLSVLQNPLKSAETFMHQFAQMGKTADFAVLQR
jgi:hypothetical protein